MLFLFSDFLLYTHIVLDGAKYHIKEKLKLDGKGRRRVRSK